MITYDEHGGFYDHVPPPNIGVPAPDSMRASNGYLFDSLGIRIPTIAVSPWIKKGTIVHDPLKGEQPTPYSAFESTSIIATSNILLGLQEARPLGARVPWANTFASLMDLDSPREDCLSKLPSLPIDPNPLQTFEMLRARPASDHLESMQLYYCMHHYPEENAKGECPGRPSVLTTQGAASDWVKIETEKYKVKFGIGKPVTVTSV